MAGGSWFEMDELTSNYLSAYRCPNCGRPNLNRHCGTCRWWWCGTCRAFGDLKRFFLPQ